MVTMEELVQTLNEASENYYNGRETMSNFEWDALLGQLVEMERQQGRVLPDSPTQSVGAPAVSNLEKFTHPYPAKSLDKTKDIDLFSQKFAEGIVESGGGNNHLVVMYKEDGSTVQAYYKKGRLQKLVTRGNGEVGSVITHNAKCITGLPISISYPGELVVRGEVVMSYQHFEEINSKLPDDEKYRNPRNLASATLTMLDSKEAKYRHLVLQAFNLVHIDETDSVDCPASGDKYYEFDKRFSHRLDFLDDLGFNTVDREVCEFADLKATMNKFTEDVPCYPYPVDGLVVAMDNYAYSSKLEGTEHHPHIMQGYAFKWADEESTTTLREIEWSPSRTGLLNPVAIFDPVEIDGTTVQRASLHNLSIMRGLRIRVGDQINVIKANQIIPMITTNLNFNDHEDYSQEEVDEIIGSCPCCGTKAVVKTSSDGIQTVYCPNELCLEKLVGKFEHFCSRDCMDIAGMSEETIRKLIAEGFIHEYKDFYTLDQHPQIALIPGFGDISWRNMIDSAERSRKSATFVKFVTAIGIPNIGKGQAKTLFKYLQDNYENLCGLVTTNFDKDEFKPFELLAALAMEGYNFSIIPGFGDKLNESLIKWAKEYADPYDESSEVWKVFDLLDFNQESTNSSRNTGSKLENKTFCITGKLVSFKNRKELVDVIESNGGKWVDSVSSKTNYLINNDTTSTSGKNKKAKELNIPIISEQDFLELIK